MLPFVICQPRHSSSQDVNYEQVLMIWYNNIKSNQASLNNEMLIEKAKHFEGKLNVTDYSHFFEEKYCVVLTNSIRWKIRKSGIFLGNGMVRIIET